MSSHIVSDGRCHTYAVDAEVAATRNILFAVMEKQRRLMPGEESGDSLARRSSVGKWKREMPSVLLSVTKQFPLWRKATWQVPLPPMLRTRLRTDRSHRKVLSAPHETAYRSIGCGAIEVLREQGREFASFSVSAGAVGASTK
jgi:hypothetical protein